MGRVRADFAPTLPALLRRRFGVPPVVTLAVALLACAVAVPVAIAAITGSNAAGSKVVHERAPVFNLLHPDSIRPVKPQRGELLRLEGRRQKLDVAIVVRPLDLPPYDGDATHGLLPVYSQGFAEAQRRALPGFRLGHEGSARINNGVGYEIGFSAVRGGERTYGREILLGPDDPEDGKEFVTISLRQHKVGGPLTGVEAGFAFAARKVYRSFRFGTGRR